MTWSCNINQNSRWLNEMVEPIKHEIKQETSSELASAASYKVEIERSAVKRHPPGSDESSFAGCIDRSSGGCKPRGETSAAGKCWKAKTLAMPEDLEPSTSAAGAQPSGQMRKSGIQGM